MMLQTGDEADEALEFVKILVNASPNHLVIISSQYTCLRLSLDSGPQLSGSAFFAYAAYQSF